MQVSYVAFWDEVTLATQEAEGHKIDENEHIGKWRIVIVKDLPFTDQRLNGKIPKVLFIYFRGNMLFLVVHIAILFARVYTITDYAFIVLLVLSF